MDIVGRVRELLARPDGDSSELLWQLARDAAADGATPETLLAVSMKLVDEADKEHEDQLLDVLDGITGWCLPDARVFP